MKKIETERLYLKRAKLEDSDFIFELLNSISWIKYIGDKKITTVNKAKDYIQETLINSYDKNGFGLLIIKLKDETSIGLCGFLKREYLKHADLGFALLQAYEGNGYAFEATYAIMEYGESELDLKKVMAICMETNQKSLQLLSKLGFKKIDTIKPSETSEELLLLST
ncbi:GNAT family N-acetyltransferase [Maribacter arcticus]|uniref:Protein N-acetyltransferase, RimJ/RimL family n=1 Tax=Maribacter arcticus TaxID=561365 RepID=A0A1T5A864_9FLAO|nr:GNAT family N-acetyltransferase [Maribacter arcticus]SKB31222.1 Protein N-acetyltransferase, RimJ/RimL family [Maribacter arcticus]|tara:strand:+ start:717 stop:1217 length:501 start_codon:yes stop_codon:yes gene_type:complete